MHAVKSRDVLSHKSIGDLKYGEVGQQIDALLLAIGEDLALRPHVATKRSLTLKLEFKPVLRDGELDRSMVTVTLTHDLPPARVEGLVVDAGPRGQMLFRGDSPAEPDQQIIPFGEA